MADKDKDKDASKFLGGMSGAAAKAIKGRSQRLQEEEDKATGGSPNQNESTGVDGKDRPAQRKRWYE